MLCIFRALIVIPYCILLCLFGSIYCLLSPRNPRNVYKFARFFRALAPILGLTVESRFPADMNTYDHCVYIANHQNNYDMVVGAFVFQPRTVTVGKKSLAWIPFFGQLYWLTGNILIDRKNRARSHNTITQIAEQINKRNLSIWMFPEGTRSRGRGLIPFKSGAFHAAIAAQVPIVPICISTTSGKININRWSNGHVIVEMLPAIDVSSYSRDRVHELTKYCHELMSTKIESLDKEVAELNAKKKK